MSPTVASLAYACGIAGLFYLDRDKSARTSKALWLPVVYIWVVGSRPISAWLGIAPAWGTDVQLDGSPVDRAFFAALLLLALAVLVYRGRRTLRFLSCNWPILAYFLFCLMSVLWSSYPGVSAKRWIKAIEDLVMMLVVVTDEQSVPAIRRLLSRTGFVLLPCSVLLIKYYPGLSRAYDAYSGAQFITGVTMNKNMLGVITFVLSVGAVWRIFTLLSSNKDFPDRARHLLAQGALLLFGVYLLKLTNSDTSTVCFAIGAGMLLATSVRFVRRHPAAIHILILSVCLTAGLILAIGAGGDVIHALGRNTTLTGRTAIWAAIIPMASNPLVGAGFESFWLNPRVHQTLWQLFGNLPINEAHNGYIEVYLELGWVGLGLIGIVLVDGYRRAVKAFRRQPAVGGLFIAYILTAIVYSVTEAGFRMTDAMWIFFLLSVVGSGGIAVGIGVGAPQPLEGPTERQLGLVARTGLAMESSERTAAGIRNSTQGRFPMPLPSKTNRPADSDH